LNKVFEFVQATLKGTKQEPLAETNTTLYLSSIHPDPNIRILALNHIFKESVKDQPQEVTIFEFILKHEIINTK